MQACQEARLQLGHIGMPVVTKSAGACVHDMVPDSHYSLCPSLSSCAYEVISQQELGTGCQAKSRRKPEAPSLQEALASKTDTEKSQMSMSNAWSRMSGCYIHLFIPYSFIQLIFAG